jgi:hypothetical protein
MQAPSGPATGAFSLRHITGYATQDKQNAAIREYLADRADFVGAIRLQSDAFKREGTAVVTGIVFLRKRGEGEPPRHADPDWLSVAPLAIDGAEVPVNRYFLKHPDMVLGQWSRTDTLYGEGFSVTGNGDLAERLKGANERLPQFATLKATLETEASAPEFIPPPLLHIAEGSVSVGDDKAIRQIIDGEAVPVTYGGTSLTSYGSLTGQRLAALVALRDKARRVLQSQNEGWPEKARQEARRELNWAYDRFTFAYGPINMCARVTG